MAELGTLLRELEESATELNELCDQAVQAINHVENAINRSSLGFPAEVELDDLEFTGGGVLERCVQLSICNDRNYRIFYLSRMMGGDDIEADWRSTKWQECNRAQKLEVAAALPAIVQQVLNQANELLVAARSRAAQVTELVRGLE